MDKKLVNYLEELRKLKPEIERKYKVSDLAVFGSYVRGEETSESDLDVLVSYSKLPDLFSHIELLLYLESALGIKVDLVMNENLKPRIATHILEEKVDI
jgi:uncharacterized protein